MFLNLFSLIYIGQVKPLKGRINNIHEIASEFAIASTTILQVSFTDFVEDPTQ